jgi:hypothetical protein
MSKTIGVVNDHLHVCTSSDPREEPRVELYIRFHHREADGNGWVHLRREESESLRANLVVAESDIDPKRAERVLKLALKNAILDGVSVKTFLHTLWDAVIETNTESGRPMTAEEIAVSYEALAEYEREMAAAYARVTK